MSGTPLRRRRRRLVMSTADMRLRRVKQSSMAFLTFCLARQSDRCFHADEGANYGPESGSPEPAAADRPSFGRPSPCFPALLSARSVNVAPFACDRVERGRRLSHRRKQTTANARRLSRPRLSPAAVQLRARPRPRCFRSLPRAPLLFHHPRASASSRCPPRRPMRRTSCVPVDGPRQPASDHINNEAFKGWLMSAQNRRRTRRRAKS